MIRTSWTRMASVEETLALWAASLREIKQRIRPLFKQERVARNVGLFLEGLLGDEQRKTGFVLRPLRHDADPQQSGRIAREWFDRKRAWPSQKSAGRCPAAACLARLRRSSGMAGLRRRDCWPRQRAQCQAHRSGGDGAEETAGPQDRRL